MMPRISVVVFLSFALGCSTAESETPDAAAVSDAGPPTQDASGADASCSCEGRTCGMSSCGEPCGPGCSGSDICAEGTCVSGCPSGTYACDGACVDLRADPANCGSCGTACETGLSCVDAECRCVGVECDAVGGPCTDDAMCTAAEGFCFTDRETAFEDGYCSALCSASNPCPVASVCANFSDGGIHACVRSCLVDTDCRRAGYRCQISGDVGVCLPG